MNLIEKQKEIEERVRLEADKMDRARRGVSRYAPTYLHRAEKIPMTNIDFEIQKAMRETV